MLTERLRKRLDGFSDCSVKGKRKVNNLFKLMVNTPELWELAYQNVQGNKGATTKGPTSVTIDGHSEDRIREIMTQVRNCTYKPKPVRRTYIPKSNGKLRPLGIPDAHDKLVQEVCRIILESIYEPVFLKNSYGFRPQKSCHHALSAVHKYWTGTRWFIEFDIKGCFDNINHDKLMEILAEKIDDNRFLDLIRQILKAGYLEEWHYHGTYSGTPQGGVISPILSNIYLNELDKFATKLCEVNYLGKQRKQSEEAKLFENRVRTIRYRIEVAKSKGEDISNYLEQLDEIKRERLKAEASDPMDQEFRRLNYVRYADDFLFGYIGSKEEAEKLMREVKGFVQNTLRMECAEDKTKIVHHQKGVRFLGFDLRTTKKITPKYMVQSGRKTLIRLANNRIYLFIPDEKLKAYSSRKGYGAIMGDTASKRRVRPQLLNNGDLEILLQYNSEVRGFCNYYGIAQNYWSLGKLHYAAQISLVHTLANKHKCSTQSIYRKYHDGNSRFAVIVNGKTYRWFLLKDLKEVRSKASGKFSNTSVDTITQFYTGRTELQQRMEAKECEYCGTKEGYFEVHHIRALKDIRQSKAPWAKFMIARRRKTLVLCSGHASSCHVMLHQGTLPDRRNWQRAS